MFEIRHREKRKQVFNPTQAELDQARSEFLAKGGMIKKLRADSTVMDDYEAGKFVSKYMIRSIGHTHRSFNTN